MRGITFDDKHSFKDFGLTLASRHIGNPTKIKRKQRIPFSNIEYDFSGIYGGQEYETRPLTYVFNVVDMYNQSKHAFSSLKIAVLNWLMGPNVQTKLYDDAIPGYYFLAEVENGPDIEEYEFDGPLTVEFTAYPFKISELKEGHDIWDEFNFLLDYAQITEFRINGTDEITLYNPGISVLQPKIIASNAMEIIKGNTTFNVSSGESQSHDFILHQGENKMTINGNGTIEFLFHKELI